MDSEFEALKDEALSLGIDKQTFDYLKSEGFINDLKGIIAKTKEVTERDKTVNKYNRIRNVGKDAVPGIRSQDMEWAGQLWESLQKGETTQAQWDKFVEGLYSSGKAPRPEPVVPEVVTPEVTPVLPEFVMPEPDVPEPWEMTKKYYLIYMLEQEAKSAKSIIAEYPDGKYRNRPSNYGLWTSPKRRLKEDGAAERALDLINQAITGLRAGESLAGLRADAAIPQAIAKELEARTQIISISEGNHARSVKRAVTAGEPVDTMVIAEYPELAQSSLSPEQIAPEVATPEVTPEPVAPEPAAEPPAVTVAQDIISGKYDSLPLGDVLKLAGPVMDLDEAMYADLMDQVDAYTTVLTKKAVQAKFAE